MSRLRRVILHRNVRRALAAILCTTLLCATAVSQQRRKQRTPRAIGLVEWPAKGKPVLVPIAILIDGRFYDASIYMADPVPMALETGTVYEVEKSGEPVGFATLEGGLNSNGNWIGAAKYQTKEAALAPPKKTAPAFRPDPEQGPPRLRKGGAKAEEKTADKSADKTLPAPTDTQTTATGGDDDRPRLKKPKEEQQPAAPPANANPPAQPASAAPPTTSDSDEDATGRPRLRRGKPVATNVESSPAPTVARTTTTSTAVRGREAQHSAPVKIMAAVSDAGGPEPRSFVAVGSEHPSPKMRSGMEELAKTALQKYAASHGGATVGALENEDLRAFDLSLTNQSTVVLIASAHPAPPQPATRRAAQRQSTPEPNPSVDPNLTFWVTIVARENYNGDLRLLQTWVTDSKHLDAYPRMELIDALDADGDGRGELLFRAVNDLGRSFVINRITGDQVVALYDSGDLIR